MNIVIENSNSDIIESLNIATLKKLTGVFAVNDLFVQISPLQYEKVIFDITALQNSNDIMTLKSLISFIQPKNLILVIGSVSLPKEFLTNIINIGIYNIAYTSDHIVELYSSPNSFEDAIVLVSGESKKVRIIGFKNITKHAGATTLIYVLKKYLEKSKKIAAFEVDKMDFTYFYDKELVTVTENNLEMYLDKSKNYDIIFIDVNSSQKALGLCNEVIYLIEPTTIKINQAMMVDPTMFSKLKSEKVILNMSPLNHAETKEFEAESHLKIFYSLPIINERNRKSEFIKELIDKLKL